MNIKKTNPTPKSITHKNPVYIFALFRNKSIPIPIKYIKLEYKIDNRLVLVRYEIKVSNNIDSVSINSLKINYKICLGL